MADSSDILSTIISNCSLAVATKNRMNAVQMVNDWLVFAVYTLVIGICQWHNRCIISYSLVMKILVVFWPWKRAEKILVDVQSVRQR